MGYLLEDNNTSIDLSISSSRWDTTVPSAPSIVSEGDEYGGLLEAPPSEEDGANSSGEAQPNATKGKTRASNDKSDTPVLDKYGVNMNAQARDKKLDPVYGRDQEILRIAQILSRKKKNNPLLIGEPGVGKTAIVEALAQRIEKNEAPIPLLGKKIISIDLASMVAGSMYRGQFEERMKSLIDELKSSPDVILYIDEVHTIIGSGNSSGGLDAANILKPALARGELRCIGATTSEEYRKTIERDGAMDRRFQKVTITAPDEAETREILRALRPRYEKHHRVAYTDEALEACVRLSAQYITDRAFPDKAIDAMDEAGAYTFMKYQKPVDFSSYEKKIQEARDLKLRAVQESNYEMASKYRDEEKEYMAELSKFKKELEAGAHIDTPIVVGVAEVEQVVSAASGIPVASFTKDDLTSLAQLEERLKRVVVGQDAVVHAVSSAIQRNKIGLRNKQRPIGTFLFLGSSGVGKTHLSKQLAKELFGSEDALVRFDMSEFMERHTVSRLIGAPPGYVGYDEGGELTTKVKRRPYAVVLFDEIEKAHPDVHNLLLQLMDDGVLTDSYGNKVNFKNTIVIMTSNAGTKQLKEFGTGIGFRTDQQASDQLSAAVIQKSLRKTFSPEFLNRIDGILTFNSLSTSVIRSIVDLELSHLDQRLQELEIEVEYTDAARTFVADKGYDPQLGARPLQRAIAKYVEEIIAQGLIDGTAHRGGKYTVNVDPNHTEQLIMSPLVDRDATTEEPVA